MFSLQYCLWDLFREMGERVSDADDDDDAGGDGDRREEVSPTRVRNLARAYAWWIAKGAVTLTILKVSEVFYRKEESFSDLPLTLTLSLFHGPSLPASGL